MRRILGWLALAVLLVVLGGAGWFVRSVGGLDNAWGMLRYDQRSEGHLKVGDPAPDVTLLAPAPDPSGPWWIGDLGSRGDSLAQSPNAPSRCSQAPEPATASAISSSGSKQPEFTSPA